MTTETVNMLEHALRYASLGWYIAPLHTPREDGTCDCRKPCTDQGKHPRTRNGIKDSSNDPSQVRKWWRMWPTANIALDLLKNNLLDIAPDSVEYYAEFVAQGLPETAHFASGGGEGHAHYLYVRPEDCPVDRWTESGRFDILSNGYAVLPPSLHRLQRRYEWLGMPPGEALRTAAPRWVVESLLGRVAHHTRPTAPRSDDPGAPPVRLRGDALERWHGRLYDINPETGELDRSYSLWSLAVALLEAGCAPAFVEDLLAERDATLGWDKFTDRRDAIERYGAIVDRARASQGPRVQVNRTAKAAVPPLQTQAALRWQTITEFNATEDEDVAWSVVGIVGNGLIAELDGRAKRSGKTTLLLSMSRAILHGEPFLGQPTAYSPVVYLTEQSGPSFKRSLRRSGLVDGDAFHLLLWGDTKGWTWEQLIPEALAKVDEVGARVLIIDTLAQFSGVRGDDENRSGSALEVMEPLQAATKRPLGILISRHDRKAGGLVGDSGRGSSAFAGAVDIILHLDRPEQKPGTERQRVIEGLSRFEETPDNLLIELGEAEPQSYSVVGNVEAIKSRDLRADVLASLPTDEGHAIERDELLARVHGQAIEVLRVVKVLVNEHEVVRIGAGVKGNKYRYYQRVWDGDDD